MQNLTDYPRRFKKEGWGRSAELQNQDKAEVQKQTKVIGEQQPKSIEMKIVLAMLDEEDL